MRSSLCFDVMHLLAINISGCSICSQCQDGHAHAAAGMSSGEGASAPPSADKEPDCAPCRALSDLLRGMPGMRDHSARRQPSSRAGDDNVSPGAPSEHAAEAGGHQDCMTCRVLGTTVCGACSAYLAGHLYMVQPSSRSHRMALAAGATAFAGLAVLRATT